MTKRKETDMKKNFTVVIYRTTLKYYSSNET